MITGALIVFSLLVIFIAACLLPWWFLPVCFVVGFLWIAFGPKQF